MEIRSSSEDVLISLTFAALISFIVKTKRSMKTEKRASQRVAFAHGVAVHMMAIDGTWRRSAVMEDASETGAKLTIAGSVEGLHLKEEFFLLLSSTGLAYRRCELAWVNGDQIGVTFLKQNKKGAGTKTKTCA